MRRALSFNQRGIAPFATAAGNPGARKANDTGNCGA